MAGAGYADILEYLVVNLSEQIHIEIIRMEDVGVLAEANRLEPTADLTHIASASSSAFASLRSRVSNPSVNHP